MGVRSVLVLAHRPVNFLQVTCCQMVTNAAGKVRIRIELAPEAGLEPATRRLIPTRSRDSTIEQAVPNPARRFPGLVARATKLPFELALIWREQIKDDPALSQAKIAVREGISRARVTRIMDLLRLPAEIKEGLQRATLCISSMRPRQNICLKKSRGAA